jgi:threonine synthase
MCKTENFVSSLSMTYDYDQLSKRVSRDYFATRPKEAGVWKYLELLPIREEAHRITLSEGSTPLVRCERWGKEMGLKTLYVKDESRNPTWSFKDRHASVAISMALEQGASTVTIATSGNHGAATAAYAAKAGLAAVIFTYPGYYETMRTLMQIYGAYVFVTDVEGRWLLMREGMKRYGWYPIGNMTTIPTLNPFGHEGHKTIAYEICEDLHWEPPDFVLVPSGFSEGLYGIWKGFKELKILGLIDRTPRMVATEPAGGAPLATALERGQDIALLEKDWSKMTVARGIACSTNSYIGVLAVRESGGLAVRVSDEEILVAQKTLAREGIYAECTAATAAAGLKKMANSNNLHEAVAVVVNSSCGIKDFTVTAARMAEPPAIEADFAALQKAAAKVYGIQFK